MTPYNDHWESCERTVAQLLIYPGDLTPDHVTEMLKIPPTIAQTKGEKRRSSTTGVEREIKLNGWFLSSEGQVGSRDLRRHVDWLLRRLAASAPGLAQLQAHDGVRMCVKCIWWGGGGPVLWPEQMARLAQLNLECAFEFADYGEEP
jgi:hypothetical protein